MDGQRFDALTFRIAASRRGVFKALLATAAAGVLGRTGEDGAEAATCRPLGSVCTKHAICCSRRCGPKDLTGRRRCECQSAANCPTPSNQCQQTVCSAGKCSVRAKQNGASCDDGNACTEGDTCQNGTCQPGTPKSCPVCQQCSSGQCVAVASDPGCAGSCVNGGCVTACVGVQELCAFPSNNCCQDEWTECTPAANSSTQQGEARCCRINGVGCSVDDDCCDNAECIDSICGLGPGQQCTDRTECGEFGSECCDGICRTLANDPANCGACGKVCPTLPGGVARCVTFGCKIECTGGRSLCLGVCRDLNSDELNCGACGHECAVGETCCSGVCRDLRSDERNCGQCNFQCNANQTCCNETCTDLNYDNKNCGSCGYACSINEPNDPDCCGGSCTSTDHDVFNCGSCGHFCGTRMVCEGSLCKLTTF